MLLHYSCNPSAGARIKFERHVEPTAQCLLKQATREGLHGRLQLKRRKYRVLVEVFSTGILKISVVTDKQKYRIYRKFISDRNKISKEI
jgi:hypothetical protein